MYDPMVALEEKFMGSVEALRVHPGGPRTSEQDLIMIRPKVADTFLSGDDHRPKESF